MTVSVLLLSLLLQDQFLRATPVSGGVGEFLMRKMGWKTGEGLGRNRKGTVEPIIIDFKVDRKGTKPHSPRRNDPKAFHERTESVNSFNTREATNHHFAID